MEYSRTGDSGISAQLRQCGRISLSLNNLLPVLIFLDIGFASVFTVMLKSFINGIATMLTISPSPPVSRCLSPPTKQARHELCVTTKTQERNSQPESRGALGQDWETRSYLP